MLPIDDVLLTKEKGAFKPCRWCGGRIGCIEEAPIVEPARHAGRMICAGCGRQIAWLSAKQVRRAERLTGNPA